MSVVCVSNLKGGVGKSSVAANSAMALALRGCETLLIDLDPQASASHILVSDRTKICWTKELRDYLSKDLQQGLYQRITNFCNLHTTKVADSLSLLPLGSIMSSSALEGVDAENRANLVSEIITSLTQEYDYLLIDTAPYKDSVLTAALAAASLVIVPVDPSAFSVMGAQKLLSESPAKNGQAWSIVRTLVNTRATRVARDSASAISDEVSLDSLSEPAAHKKISMKGVPCWKEDGHSLFLSGVVIPRSEQAHRLTFKQSTVFAQGNLENLKTAYKALAREIEEVLDFCEESRLVDLDNSMSDFLLNANG